MPVKAWSHTKPSTERTIFTLNGIVMAHTCCIVGVLRAEDPIDA